MMNLSEQDICSSSQVLSENNPYTIQYSFIEYSCCLLPTAVRLNNSDCIHYHDLSPSELSWAQSVKWPGLVSQRHI